MINITSLSMFMFITHSLSGTHSLSSLDVAEWSCITWSYNLKQVGRLHCLLPWWEDAIVDFMTSGGYNVVSQIKKVFSPIIRFLVSSCSYTICYKIINNSLLINFFKKNILMKIRERIFNPCYDIVPTIDDGRTVSNTKHRYLELQSSIWIIPTKLKKSQFWVVDGEEKVKEIKGVNREKDRKFKGLFKLTRKQIKKKVLYPQFNF